MNNKVQNIVLKAISYIIILVGVVLTINVVGDGNPPAMSDAEFEQYAIREAKEQNLQDKMTQVELDRWVVNRGKEIRDEQMAVLYEDVSSIYSFTYFILVFILLLVGGAFVYLLVINPRKAVMILAKIGVVAILLFIIYKSVDSTVPQDMIDNEIAKLVPEDERVYTADNWQLASFFWVSFEWLFGAAVLGIIAGFFAKLIK